MRALLLSTIVLAASACTTPATRLRLIGPPGHSAKTLIAARRRNVRRSVIQNPRGLSKPAVDPVPLMVGAAVLAAAGPPAVKSIKSLPKILARPFKRNQRSSSSVSPSLLRPDGTLEDEEMVRAARAGLTAWREASPSARAIPLSENALGVAMLDFTTRGLLTRRGDALRELCELMLLVPRSTTLIALRRATTAAARLTFGAGRDGNALVAGLKEERCGALLLLLNCLRWPLELSRFAGTAPGVASAAATTSFLESGTEDATALEEYAALKFQIGLAFGQQSDAMDSHAQALLSVYYNWRFAKRYASRRAMLWRTTISTRCSRRSNRSLPCWTCRHRC